MHVAFSHLENSIWRTGCSCFSTGTAILFHFQRAIEVTLESFFTRRCCLNRALTSLAFKQAILAAVHWRNWIYLAAVQFLIRLHPLMAFRIDLVVWLKFYRQYFFRGQGMQKGGDLMVAGQEFIDVLFHNWSSWNVLNALNQMVVMSPFADHVFAHLIYEFVDSECCSFTNWQGL